MDESQKTSCRAKSKSQKVTYSMTLYDKLCLAHGQVMTTGMENRLVMSRIYEWREYLTKKGQHEAIWEVFCILTVVKQIYMYIKVHGIIYQDFFLLNRYFF